MRVTLVRQVLVLLAAGLLAGCQARGADVPAEPPLAEVPRPQTIAEVTTPVEAYVGTAPQRQTLARAEDVLTRACMRTLGLDWPVERPRPLRMTLQAWDLGFLDAEAVPHSGYHPPGLRADLDASIGGPADGARILNQLQTAAYTGASDAGLAGKPVPPGGCGAEAQRRLKEGGPEADVATAIDLANATGERALADSRVVDVSGEWSACMADQGYHYASPYEARDDPRWNGADGDPPGPLEPGAVEIRTAAADLACRQRVNYLGIRLTVLRAYQTREIQAQPELFARIREQHGQRLRNAELVLR